MAENILDIQNPLGKVMVRSGLRFENFMLIKGVKLTRQNFFISSFFSFLDLFTQFKHFFAPTPQSSMSKLFRYSESFGENNGKKWSRIVQLLLIKDVKPLRALNIFFLLL